MNNESKSTPETPEVAELAHDLAQEFDLSRHGEDLIYNKVIVLLTNDRTSHSQAIRERVEVASGNCKYGHAFTAQCERCVARQEMKDDILALLNDSDV